MEKTPHGDVVAYAGRPGNLNHSLTLMAGRSVNNLLTDWHGACTSRHVEPHGFVFLSHGGTGFGDAEGKEPMRHEGTRSLFQYWNRLRDSRPAPRRTEIEPADIKTLLADTFILEKDTRGEAVFRLAGTRLCAIFGRELKGFAFSSLWAEKDQRMAGRLVHGALHQHSVVVFGIEGISGNGRRNEFEMLVLPLEGGADNQRALGSLMAVEKPFWLGADPIVECRVETLRVVDPQLEPVFLRNRPAMPVPPLAPEQAGPMRDRGFGRRIRHLVVLEGGRNE
jgi:hypothetical protein